VTSLPFSIPLVVPRWVITTTSGLSISNLLWKSSEEGLEQSFNSLDAQREACEAFILSQREEGWKALPARYDDGGYSGGTMERPALQRLLADVEAGKVNVIVVYKVDRLTRSLADFAKIVEALDRHGVSFVSVTQQFNTTSSMGRLTLNVLLSFAQFEREVTGERIRDKIAASKRKGIWMGGPVPLGYDLEARKLVPNTKEAALVCKIFSLYLELGCVSRLAIRLARENIRSKAWITKAGIRLGGNAFARGALYNLLRNRLYIGEIRHRDQWYTGEHRGIVPRELWDKVQAQMSSNRKKRHGHIRERSSSLLTGLLADASGNRFTPSFTFKKRRRYCYYVSQLAIKNPATKLHGPIRLPAREIENRAQTEVKGSAGYVAMERVTGTLKGRKGSFVLQHSATMNRGVPELSITVVPDSGSHELQGLIGKMNRVEELLRLLRQPVLPLE